MGAPCESGAQVLSCSWFSLCAVILSSAGDGWLPVQFGVGCLRHSEHCGGLSMPADRHHANRAGSVKGGVAFEKDRVGLEVLCRVSGSEKNEFFQRGKKQK